MLGKNESMKCESVGLFHFLVERDSSNPVWIESFRKKPDPRELFRQRWWWVLNSPRLTQGAGTRRGGIAAAQLLLAITPGWPLTHSPTPVFLPLAHYHNYHYYLSAAQPVFDITSTPTQHTLFSEEMGSRHRKACSLLDSEMLPVSKAGADSESELNCSPWWGWG